MNTPSPRHVRIQLVSQPALAGEVRECIATLGKPTGIALLSLRTGADVHTACAGWQRFLDPGSRVESCVYISHNSGVRRVYRSLMDGSERSMSAEWKMPVGVRGWIYEQGQTVERAMPEAKAWAVRP